MGERGGDMPETDSGDSLHADLLLDSTLASVDRGELVAMEAAGKMGFGTSQIGDLVAAAL